MRDEVKEERSQSQDISGVKSISYVFSCSFLNEIGDENKQYYLSFFSEHTAHCKRNPH